MSIYVAKDPESLFPLGIPIDQSNLMVCHRYPVGHTIFVHHLHPVVIFYTRSTFGHELGEINIFYTPNFPFQLLIHIVSN